MQRKTRQTTGGGSDDEDNTYLNSAMNALQENRARLNHIGKNYWHVQICKTGNFILICINN